MTWLVPLQAAEFLSRAFLPAQQEKLAITDNPPQDSLSRSIPFSLENSCKEAIKKAEPVKHLLHEQTEVE